VIQREASASRKAIESAKASGLLALERMRKNTANRALADVFSDGRVSKMKTGDTYSHRASGRLSTISKWWGLVGARSTLQWYLIRVCQILGIRTPKSWRVRPRQVQHTLTARLRGASDMRVFWQIFNIEDIRACEACEMYS